MRTLIVGDVHGCSIELHEILTYIQPSRTILVGDLFTKGPDALGVWNLITHYGIEATLGNHDVALSDNKNLNVPDQVYAYIDNLPLIIELDTCLVVHAGLNPNGHTSKQQATTIRRFPNDLKKANPFWWELISTTKLIVYGHDAKRGLQDHRPKTLGLDTGCVYGGALTGFIVEENRLISISAKKVYHPIKDTR
jgi:hypothetical protein